MNDIEFEPIPKKRRGIVKYVWTAICSIAAILLMALACLDQEDVYYIDKTQKNTTDCYKREKKRTASGVFMTALTLLGVVVSTVVARLSLVAEECFHVRERYEGNGRKMMKASCFGGISCLGIGALLVLSILICVPFVIHQAKPVFELSYLAYISSGIGVGPLMVILLNLDQHTESEVYISTLLEEKGLNVGNELARAYYFNHLRQALEKFHHIIVQLENERLSLKKLLLLITLNDMDDLSKIDTKVERLDDIVEDGWSFPVYGLTVDKHKQEVFAIEYVRKPLEILRYMKLLNGFETKRTTFDEEVKLFCRTLSKSLEPEVQKMCVLVPIAEKDNLKNGGLVACIMEVVNHSRKKPGRVPGFAKLKARPVTNNGNKLCSVDTTSDVEDSDNYGGASTSGTGLLTAYAKCDRETYL